ncbi:MAG: fimbria major subunit [Muribaculaceae bacterium]|nr:fimbria major subunit [Muribaculaceae bacterium]
MKIFNSINHKLLLSASLILTFLASACVDDGFSVKEDNYDPSKDPDMMCLVFNVGYGVSASTRDEAQEGSTQAEEPGFVDGNPDEHKMDFDTPGECFAIFFEEVTPEGSSTPRDKVKYIKRLYLSDILGKGGKVEGSSTEFTVPVICYIPKKDVDQETYKPKLSKMLVVLNGGPIYKKIHKAVYGSETDDSEVLDDVYLSNILELTWDNPAEYEEGHMNADAPGSDGRIGFNSNELYTMTNAAYWKVENNKAKLMTATPITGKAFHNLNEYLNQGEDDDANKIIEPTAVVYVERMVSKFSAPTFQTEVIGSQRVFRPDQNSMALLVYQFDENGNPVSTPKNWRIHLLGWAINGDESSSYIFKNIGNVGMTDLDNVASYLIERKNFPEWNNEQEGRSFWSIDPHYDSDIRSNGLYDFYPWQFRKAADRTDIISIQGGLSQKSSDHRHPVLRYNSFYDVLNQWKWRTTLHVHENTFAPEGQWYNGYNSEEETDENRNPTFLDNRAPILAGPHLLIAGELYLEDVDNIKYSSSGVNFGTVDHIYSDRTRRFYLDETEWVKMFLREFNRSLETQEHMYFNVYDWDETSAGMAGHQYIAYPTGLCRLFLRQNAEKFVNYDTSVTTIDGESHTYEDKNKTVDDRDVGYKFTPLTNTVIDKLFADPNVSISAPANVRNGDGRLIPWVEKKNTKWEDFGLVVRSPDGKRLKYKLESESDDPTYLQKYTDWGYDMYKSFFYEWFGPIDHYFNGYMYYAGDIRHQESSNKSLHDFYGTVRNHWYKFHVEAINSLGVPVDDPDQLIIPGHYNYNDMIVVYLDIISWHSRESIVDIE